MPTFLVDIEDLPYDPADVDSIKAWGKKLEGRTLRQVAEEQGIPIRELGGKGRFGQLLETIGFQYKPNSDPGPDLDEAGIEVKSLPIVPSEMRKKDPNGWRPKERLQLHDIDYAVVPFETWEDCSLRRKCSHMLVVTDEYEKEVSVLDYRIHDAFLLDFPLPQDEPTLKADWEYVKRMILAGRAHEISASATTYLDVARHGNADSKLKEQPFSPIGALKRGFGLKSSYIRTVYAAVGLPPADEDEVERELPLEEKVRRQFEPFIGSTNHELAERFGFNTVAKNLNELVANRCLGVSRAARAAEFARAGYVMRNVNFEPSGALAESLPFRYIRIDDLLAEECWEDSLFREQVSSRFCFTVWQKNMNKRRWKQKGGRGAVPAVLLGVCFAGIPDAVVDVDGRYVWEETRRLFAASTLSGLPSLEDGVHFHVRPHATVNQPPMVFPDGSLATKQCFWVNASYVRELVQNEMSIDSGASFS